MPLLVALLSLALVGHGGTSGVRPVTSQSVAPLDASRRQSPVVGFQPDTTRVRRTSPVPSSPSTPTAATPSPHPSTFPWWYGLAGVAFAALALGLFAWKADDWEGWVGIALAIAAVIAVIAAGATIGYSRGEDKGIVSGIRWASHAPPSDAAAALARAESQGNGFTTGKDDPNSVRDLVSLALGAGALVFLSLLVLDLRRGRLLVRSHWGGFGGGVGGWEVSPSLLYLIVGMSFVVLLVMSNRSPSANLGKAVVPPLTRSDNSPRASTADSTR